MKRSIWRQSLLACALLLGSSLQARADATTRPTTCPAFFDFEANETFWINRWADGVQVQNTQITFLFPLGIFNSSGLGTSGAFTFSNIYTSDYSYLLTGGYIDSHCYQYVSSVSGADTVWATLNPTQDDYGGSVTPQYFGDEEDYVGDTGYDQWGDGTGDAGGGYCDYDVSYDDDGNIYLTDPDCSGIK